jgi:hypothetical protein
VIAVKDALKITMSMLRAMVWLLPPGVVFLFLDIGPMIGVIKLAQPLGFPWFVTIPSMLVSFMWMVFLIVLLIQQGGGYAEWVFQRIEKCM